MFTASTASAHAAPPFWVAAVAVNTDERRDTAWPWTAPPSTRASVDWKVEAATATLPRPATAPPRRAAEERTNVQPVTTVRFPDPKMAPPSSPLLVSVKDEPRTSRSASSAPLRSDLEQMAPPLRPAEAPTKAVSSTDTGVSL